MNDIYKQMILIKSKLSNKEANSSTRIKSYFNWVYPTKFLNKPCKNVDQLSPILKLANTNLGKKVRNNHLCYPWPCQSSKRMNPRTIFEAYEFVDKLNDLNNP